MDTQAQDSEYISKNPYNGCNLLSSSCLEFLYSPINESCCSSLYHFGLACFCPCIMLGQLRTLTHHEKIYDTSILSLSMGRKGFVECCQTIPLLMFWPCPLCLGYHLYQKAKILRIVYEEVENNNSKFLDCLFSFIFWPCKLLQIKAYLLRQKYENNLRFDWQEKISKNENKYSSVRKYSTVVIIGPKKSGKSSLFTKLISPHNSPASGVPNSLPINKVQVGVKALSVCSGMSNFLELWDIPSDEINSTQFQLIMNEVRTVLLVYDWYCTVYNVIYSFYKISITLFYF